MRRSCALLALVAFVALFPGCPSEEKSSPAGGSGAAAPPPSTGTTGGGEPTRDERKADAVALAKEAVSEFEKAVEEVVAALADKPDEAVALPKLEAVYEAYRPKMEAIAAGRKKLTDPEVRGAFYRCMEDHRPQAVFRMNQALDPYLFHYGTTKPGPKVEEFLTTKVVALIEIAHNR